MTAETLLILSLIVPFAAAGLIPMFHRAPNVRETVTLSAAVVLFLIVLARLWRILAGERPSTGGLEVATGLDLRLAIEPLGMLFATVASSLWIVNSIYSIGYMRGNDEPRQTSFYVCFAVAIGSTVAIAFAANLFTLFIGYEALTLSTYPLVTHKGT
ncbi:MAG TPA: monovalent cation/H+ antiporter subunit D family protein, partial [Hyphomicrobiales bacterium]|nr:monovalent cation/H+ antiporter subunit D family protein [Hyphomicrobiales bacterium]